MKFDLGGLKDCLRTASVVGAGGAGFPSYMKLSAGADTLLINGAECEPLLETDFVLVRDHLSEVVAGARAVMEAASIPTCLLCMKKHNLPRLGLTDGEKIGDGVFVKMLPDAYPMGDEVNMIAEATGRIIRPGNLPITVGCIVYNVETVYNIYRAVSEETPVTEKWLCIGGDVPETLVVKVPVGTRVRDLFDHLGITVPETHAVLDGGPSMGAIVNPATATVKKNSKSFLLLPRTAPAVVSKVVDLKTHATRAATACCQCTRCTDMCPRNLLGYPLYPHMMVRSVTTVAEVTPEMVLSASLCCSCGICELAACCQNISPRAMIQEFKGILAKNKLKFVATEDVSADPAREYRKLPSDRWMMHLGVSQFAHNPVKTVLDGYEPSAVEIGMNGHIGAPSVPTVKVGDTVAKGEKIADAAEGLSLPQYASVDGKVVFVDRNKVILERV